ncbi:MAG: ATP-binding cassette domain-containing protein [Rubrivivax sp.]|nr:MAG: ATP-binding cassette domain-containing protein [Rubrivivax sp.]
MKIDVDIGLTLRSGAQAFTLDARFESSQDRIVLFGPSGVGKTMTVQTIAGLQRPDRGHVRLGGRVLFDHERGIDVPARDRRIGYVFQDHALFPHLSVARNIAFSLLPTLPWRLSAAHQRRVADIMKALDIDGLQDRLPSHLSGGQRQRVALARALICEPEVLLLDEPFSALDMALRGRVREELDAVQRRFKVPMVLISHDLDDVRLFADTLVLYEPGRVAQITHRQGEDRSATLAAAEASWRR